MQSNPSNFKSYFSYGLKVSSFIHLPSLVETDKGSAVDIQSGFVKNSKFYTDFAVDKLVHRPEISLTVRATKNEFCFDWRGLACCYIKNGNEVTIELDPRIAEDDFVPFVTGPIFAVLLHQLNHLVLHSSVVKIDNKAVLFVGNKGHGKSTLAAHLQARGHHLISDDLAPISFTAGVPFTIPGHPQMRLLPDAVESLGLAPEDFPLVNSGTTKRQVKPETDFSIDPVEVGSIFVLDFADTIGIAELNKPMAFIEIARNSYLSLYIEATGNTPEHFQQCNTLAKNVPVFKLSRPRTFDGMHKVVELIEKSTHELIA